MAMLRFRGGPWHGFVIEYGERVTPDARLDPVAAVPPAPGHYLLNEGGRAYVWSAGIVEHTVTPAVAA